MTIQDYKLKAQEVGFIEFPFVMTGYEPSLNSFIEFDKTDSDLKIYLAKLILCRSFSPTGGVCWPDSKWFISSFIAIYNRDFVKPWITSTIKEATEMILSGEHFTKGIIGTTFLFGVIEFYAKHLLGWKPDTHDFFDKKNHDKFRNLTIGDAIRRLKKTNSEIAESLNEIDNYNVRRLKDVGIPEYRWTIARIADRLTISRNTMLHGENHSFYDKGEYLIMLYILFWLHDYKKSDISSSPINTPELLTSSATKATR